MVKAVTKAMTATTQFTQTLNGVQAVERFVVAGASKRGWTTWLTGAGESTFHSSRQARGCHDPYGDADWKHCTKHESPCTSLWWLELRAATLPGGEPNGRLE